ncbi:MAG: exosortase-associated EpsI family protein [Thermogutta sp.]
MMAARKGTSRHRRPVDSSRTGASPSGRDKLQAAASPAGPSHGPPRNILSFSMRCVIAAIGILFVGLGTRWAASQAVPNTVRVPTQEQLEAFPTQLGPWQLDDEQQVDAKILQVLGTSITLTRRYSQSAERVAELHAAVFTQTGFSLPHPPELCYSGTGWKVRSTRDARIILADGTSGSARILRLEKERENRRATVLYCYQLASSFAADRDTVRTFFWKFRGQKSRPPLLKLMAYLPGSGENVEELGLDFMQRALEKFTEMQKPGNSGCYLRQQSFEQQSHPNKTLMQNDRIIPESISLENELPRDTADGGGLPPTEKPVLADPSLEESIEDWEAAENFKSTVSPTDRLLPKPAGDLPVTIIRPTRGWRALDLREVWRYRELMLTLAWREITIRYKQTFLGAAWAVIQPLMTTGIFSVLFALLMGRGNEPTPEGIPYAISTFCAMLPWQLFATSLNQSGNILIQYRGMITKIYFPRLILPAAAVLSALVDFAIGFIVLLALMALHGVYPGWAVLTVPVFVFLVIMASLAAGLWLAALNAIYRDFRYVIPFIIQVGMFVSPVVYSIESIRGRLSDSALTLYSLNPMAGVIEGFRWALLGTSQGPGPLLALSVLATTVILIGGMFYFRRMERLFADVI